MHRACKQDFWLNTLLPNMSLHLCIIIQLTSCIRYQIIQESSALKGNVSIIPSTKHTFVSYFVRIAQHLAKCASLFDVIQIYSSNFDIWWHVQFYNHFLWLWTWISWEYSANACAARTYLMYLLVLNCSQP